MEKGLESVTLGFVPIGKFVFSQEDARRYRRLTEKRLKDLGVRCVNIDEATTDGMLFRHDDLPKVISHLRHAKVDALFCPHCSFGTEDVAALLGREMGLPYLLWGPRDEAPLADGTRLRDTQCGLFATSRILRRLSVPFSYIPNCHLDDPVFDRGVLAFIRVASARRALRNMRIGQIGQRNDFFWTVMIDEASLLEKFGVEVYQIYLTDVVERIAELVDTPSLELQGLVGYMRSQVTFESLDDRQVNAIGALRLVLGELAEQHDLSAMALQCFPALQKRFRIYPCYANSLMTVEGVPVICETDIHGAVTACLLQAAALNETPPFFADLTIRHPGNDNAELLWHCGSFPITLADEGVSPKVGEHFIMPGPEAGVGHWRLRPGDVTIARFDADGNDYYLGFGEAAATTGPDTVGTYLWVEVEDWLNWERRFIRGPYIHHVAAIHGRLAPILHEACRFIPHLNSDPIEPREQALDEFWWR